MIISADVNVDDIFDKEISSKLNIDLQFEKNAHFRLHQMGTDSAASIITVKMKQSPTKPQTGTF